MITMTPGGKSRGEKPFPSVPWRKRNQSRLCKKCIHAKLCHDYYDRWDEYLCTIDRDQNEDNCADYEPKES